MSWEVRVWALRDLGLLSNPVRASASVPVPDE
jgi:hypothetical protein